MHISSSYLEEGEVGGGGGGGGACILLSITSVGPLRSESLTSVGIPARCNIESIVCWG